MKLTTIFGFEIRLDASWLIIAALITWSLSQHYFPTVAPGLSRDAYLVMSLVSMLCFFASLLLHELAHSVVARFFGLKIKAITLFLFGGVAEMTEEPKRAKVEFFVAIAGPLMSFALAFGFWFISALAAIAGMNIVSLVLSYLAVINLILALFNLVPAFPLDGGRILRAWLWARGGDILKATQTAAFAGTIFAIALMALGFMALFRGNAVGGLWQVMIGAFILMASRASLQSQLTQRAFEGKTVADLMTPSPIAVSPTTLLSELAERYVLRQNLSFLPVVEQGVLLGHIDGAMLRSIDDENWSTTQVGDVFAALEPELCVEPDLPLQAVLKKIGTTGYRKFMVTRDRKLIGVLTLSDLARQLQHIQNSTLQPNQA